MLKGFSNKLTRCSLRKAEAMQPMKPCPETISRDRTLNAYPGIPPEFNWIDCDVTPLELITMSFLLMDSK